MIQDDIIYQSLGGERGSGGVVNAIPNKECRTGPRMILASKVITYYGWVHDLMSRVHDYSVNRIGTQNSR